MIGVLFVAFVACGDDDEGSTEYDETEFTEDGDYRVSVDIDIDWASVTFHSGHGILSSSIEMKPHPDPDSSFDYRGVGPFIFESWEPEELHNTECYVDDFELGDGRLAAEMTGQPGDADFDIQFSMLGELDIDRTIDEIIEDGGWEYWPQEEEDVFCPPPDSQSWTVINTSAMTGWFGAYNRLAEHPMFPGGDEPYFTISIADWPENPEGTFQDNVSGGHQWDGTVEGSTTVQITEQ